MKSKKANAETLNFFGILAVGLVIVFGVFLLLQIPNGEEDQTQVRQFNSLQEIESFLKENADDGYYGHGLYAEKSFTVGGDVAAAQAEASGGDAGRSSASDFSTTNVQIEGVDEPDIVKNDGKYIYTIVDSKKVVIVNAYPADDMK